MVAPDACLPDLGRCAVMGILNVTPDSFSDGGCYADTPSAVAHGLEMRAAGADWVDVGGVPFSPDARDVSVEELDGTTLSCPDEGWWFNLRPSNTEPFLRLNVEAKDPATMERVRDRVLDIVRV